MLKNGDIRWQEADGTMRKVTQNDVEDEFYSDHIKVYFNGDWMPLFQGLTAMLAGDADQL